MLGLKLREEFQGKRLKGTAIGARQREEDGRDPGAHEGLPRDHLPNDGSLEGHRGARPGSGTPARDHRGPWSGEVSPLGSALPRLPGSGRDDALASGLVREALRFAARLASSAYRDAHHRGQPPQAAVQVPLGPLFDNHPEGRYIRGKWEGRGEKKTNVPPEDLLIELFEKKPTALLLDEFQTWFDGLTNTKQYPWRTWAFNFVQILSEIAERRPDLLVLVVSVRDGSSDAYQQIHRVNPVRIDFKGPYAARDRRRLLLHRLFENRRNVPRDDILRLTDIYASEWFRLMDVPQDDQDRRRSELLETWPFAPQLLQLLEDQVLIATEAQETRDLIRILADLYKSRESSPMLTAADFALEDDESGIAALLDSVTNEHHRTLREKAKRNLLAVREAFPAHGKEVPHLDEVVGALWLRSLSAGNVAGADQRALHLDVTRHHRVDDNLFSAELAKIVENSFNIHELDGAGERLLFREDKNPFAKLKAYARNDRLFADDSDKRQLALETRYVLGGAEGHP